MKDTAPSSLTTCNQKIRISLLKLEQKKRDYFIKLNHRIDIKERKHMGNFPLTQAQTQRTSEKEIRKCGSP